jgi:hypothetical protein
VALLKRHPCALAAAACALIASCASSWPLGHVEVALSDRDAAHDPEPGEQLEAQAFMDPDASRYAPHGLYVYFELVRSNRRRGLVELDVPTDAADDTAPAQFQASYRELEGE